MFADDALEGFERYSDYTLTNYGGALQTYIDVTSQVRDVTSNVI